jgi:hypothetical protein
MRFLRSVKEYTRLDKIRSEAIRKELEIAGIQDVRSKYKQNWIDHLERMDNTRLPKHTLNYKPRGRRDRGRPRKQWQSVDAGTGQTASSMEEEDGDEEEEDDDGDDDDDDDEIYILDSTEYFEHRNIMDQVPLKENDCYASWEGNFAHNRT